MTTRASATSSTATPTTGCARRAPEAVRAYVSANNAESIDGLTGIDPLVDDAAPVSAGRKL